MSEVCATRFTGPYPTCHCISVPPARLTCSAAPPTLFPRPTLPLSPLPLTQSVSLPSGKYPGPVIEVDEGDRIVVTVLNNLEV